MGCSVFTHTQAFAHGRAQVTKVLYNFTSEQDLKLTVGYKADVNDRGDINGVRVLCYVVVLVVRCVVVCKEAQVYCIHHRSFLVRCGRMHGGLKQTFRASGKSSMTSDGPLSRC